jgi:PTS system fructose-specific IIC component
MPNAVSGLFGYTIAIVVGTVVTAAALFLLKKPLANANT